jgi:hypothetical protein
MEGGGRGAAGGRFAADIARFVGGERSSREGAAAMDGRGGRGAAGGRNAMICGRRFSWNTRTFQDGDRESRAGAWMLWRRNGAQPAGARLPWMEGGGRGVAGGRFAADIARFVGRERSSREARLPWMEGAVGARLVGETWRFVGGDFHGTREPSMMATERGDRGVDALAAKWSAICGAGGG